MKQYIATALILILLAPVNMGASAWMNLSSISANTGDAEMTQMHTTDHDHAAMLSIGQEQSMTNAHDHSVQDCGFCMNCSNHCSTNALIASFKNHFELDREFATTIAGDTMSRVSLLFRPPISA